MRLFNFALILALAAGPAMAQDDAGFTIGGDSFLAGQSIVFDAPGADDLFVAGQSVRAATS